MHRARAPAAAGSTSGLRSRWWAGSRGSERTGEGENAKEFKDVVSESKEYDEPAAEVVPCGT
jgi:hypothetical protein